MKVGQAWLVKREDGFHLKVTFSKAVETAELDGKAVAVDVNEDNVAFGFEEKASNIKTRERGH